MDKPCWFCGDFLALLRGKVAVVGGRVCLIPVNTGVIGQNLLLDGRLVSADGAATVRNERYVLSGSRLCRLPGHRDSVGTPASRGALLCLCERIVRA